MATKIFCDACGKEIKFNVDRVYNIMIRTNIAPNKSYDFCEDCYNEFMNHSFKEKGKKDED